MLDHPIVDVALGLILLFSSLRLVASVVKEWVSSVFALRAKNLRKGIQTLIGEDHASRLYGHPLVSTLAKEKKLPSYIGSGTFASVLVDLLAHDENGKPVVAGRDKATALVDRVKRRCGARTGATCTEPCGRGDGGRPSPRDRRLVPPPGTRVPRCSPDPVRTLSAIDPSGHPGRRAARGGATLPRTRRADAPKRQEGQGVHAAGSPVPPGCP